MLQLPKGWVCCFLMKSTQGGSQRFQVVCNKKISVSALLPTLERPPTLRPTIILMQLKICSSNEFHHIHLKRPKFKKKKVERRNKQKQEQGQGQDQQQQQQQQTPIHEPQNNLPPPKQWALHHGPIQLGFRQCPRHSQPRQALKAVQTLPPAFAACLGVGRSIS